MPNIGALIIRIGFRGPLYCTDFKIRNPQNGSGTYLVPYRRVPTFKDHFVPEVEALFTREAGSHRGLRTWRHFRKPDTLL